MVWFKYLTEKSDIVSIPSTPDYIFPPLKKNIVFPDIEQQIEKDDWLFVDSSNNNINKIYLSNLSIEEQDHSYLVVCENENNDFDATPVSTIIDNGIIYFKSPKQHRAGNVLNYQYNLYYGKDYLKYIQATPAYVGQATPAYQGDISGYGYVYIQNSQATINYYLEDNNSKNHAPYSGLMDDVDLYQTNIDSESNQKYLINYFNKGTDWVNNRSEKAGSKISANFDGPNCKVVGLVGPNYGYFKYRIFEKKENIETVKIDWTNVDCYSSVKSEKDLIMINSLDYHQYYIEIETLSDTNSLSTGNLIEITGIQFLKNYNLSLTEEMINPNLSFVSIGGIR